MQLEDRWENFGSLDGIIDSDDPFTLQGAPRFELYEKLYSLVDHALTSDENLLLRQILGMGCKQRSVKELAQLYRVTQKEQLRRNFKNNLWQSLINCAIMTNRFYFGNILIDNMKTCPKCQGEMEQTGEKEFWT